MITLEQIKDIAGRVEKIKQYLHIDQKRIEVSNEEKKSVEPCLLG